MIEVLTGCVHDCGGRCVLKVHVENGVVEKITTDDRAEPQLRACLRGRAYRQRVYAPERLKFPLKREGPRGEGKFVRISWDEALDIVAGELMRIKERYGPEAILDFSGPGNISLLHGTAGGVLTRFLHLFGGCTHLRGGMSYSASMPATLYTLGTAMAGNDLEDLVNSRFIILWSWNPAETITGTNTSWRLAQAKERGMRIVGIDPRLTDTLGTFAHQWIPIRPGTDAAMMIAMAYVILKKGLQDKSFLDKYTLGFDKFRDYVLGNEDGCPKTPRWAERITGVPARVIEELAMDYATTKPAALIVGGGMQRTAYGEQPIRASITLAAMTGNIGISGGCSGGFFSLDPIHRGPLGSLPTGENPVRNTIPINNWADAVLLGKLGGYESDIKMVYCIGRNFLNQVPTVNKGIAALKKLEFFVVHEQFMTATAKFADILLPVTTWLEREDITHAGKYLIYMKKAIEPMYECKSDLGIFTELASRLGISQYNDLSEEEWRRRFCLELKVPDFAAFKKEGVYFSPRPRPRIAFQKQVEDPQHHPFSTPSGKIEIYSQRLADLNNPEIIPAIPKYIETWESINDPLARQYPLQFITPHSKRYAHSSYSHLPWLQEVEPHQIWINTEDAKKRGICQGDQVEVFNQRGAVLISAKVTERIMPGVVSIYQGAWYNPDERGIDRGGCGNVLTRDEDTPVGEGATTHTTLVEVRKI